MPRKLTEIIGSIKKEGNALDFDELIPTEQLKYLEAERYKSDTENRKWLAEWAAVIVTLWLIICFNNYLYK